MENNKMQELRIAIDFDSLKSEFANNLQVESSPDNVILNFVQSFPNVPDDKPNAKVISRIVLTWPHFAQIANLLSNVLEANRSIANDSFVQNVLKEKESTNGQGK